MSRRRAGLQAWLFVIVISLPLAATFAGIDGADPTAENRELAPFPHLADTWESFSGFGNALSRWFDDHFAFRASLVRWHARSSVFALDTSPSATVALGRDGWLFYADDGGIEDYANQTPLSDGEVGAWRQVVLRARNWLRSKRVAYVFTIAPDKHVIYPERFPVAVRRMSAVSRMDQVFEALHGSGVELDVRPKLLEAKRQERVYHVTDTHWNDRGAFAAYRALIESVRAQVPEVPEAWGREDFEAVARDVPGRDLAGMLGLTRALEEQDLALVPRRPRQAHIVEPAGAAPTAQLGRVVTEIPGSTLPRAVIFRDSFASALVPFLSEHFSRAVYLWQNDFDPEAVLRETPDLVIQEIVGRHLYTFIPTPDLVPQGD